MRTSEVGVGDLPPSLPGSGVRQKVDSWPSLQTPFFWGSLAGLMGGEWHREAEV